MGAERGLRQRIRAAIRAECPAVMIVGQPANGMTGPGRHDLYVVVRGVYVGLEVKTSTGRATQIQLGRIRDTRRAGGWSWIVRSTTSALEAVKFATWGPPQKGHMTDDFDLDRLIAGFGPSKSEAPSEEHIAAAAQVNGSAAGDGEALGEIPGATEILARSIDNLAVAVRDLAVVARDLRAARDAQAALDESDVTSVLLAGQEPEPPKPRRRGKSS